MMDTAKSVCRKRSLQRERSMVVERGSAEGCQRKRGKFKGRHEEIPTDRRHDTISELGLLDDSNIGRPCRRRKKGEKGEKPFLD